MTADQKSLEKESKQETKPYLLEGIRILDFTQLLAGPYCTRILVDMGAEVTKIERPPLGDAMRMLPIIKEGVSGTFMQFNVGKKSVCLDLKKPEAIQIVKELVRKCDVVVENNKVGVMERLGIGYQTLKRENPALIMCSISGFGQTGPNKDRPALAPVIHAATGVTEILRRSYGEDIPPASHTISWADTIASYHAANAITSALFYRERHKIGQHIDVNLFDSMFFSIDYQIQHYTLTGQEPPPAYGAPPMKGNDGYLLAAIGKHEFVLKLLDAMGRSELKEDERFSTMASFFTNSGEFKKILSDWMQEVGSDDKIEAILRELEVPVSRMYSVAEAVESPQVESRGLLQQIDHPKLGKVRVVNTPFKFSETECSLRGLPPQLGEHNREVLTETLDYNTEQIASLYEQGILFDESPAFES